MIRAMTIALLTFALMCGTLGMANAQESFCWHLLPYDTDILECSVIGYNPIGLQPMYGVSCAWRSVIYQLLGAGHASSDHPSGSGFQMGIVFANNTTFFNGESSVQLTAELSATPPYNGTWKAKGSAGFTSPSTNMTRITCGVPLTTASETVSMARSQAITHPFLAGDSE
jgi:hypothetical protein